MVSNAHLNSAIDIKTLFVRLIIRIVIIAGIALLVKYCFIDSTVIQSDQMVPSIYSGDRTLVFKTFSLPLFRSIFHPGLHQPVLFKQPINPGLRNCLRIAGIAGDTISIDSALFRNKNSGYKTDQTQVTFDLIPGEFSPRDFLEEYSIPSIGDTLVLDSLKIRDYFFAFSLIRQETGKEPIQFSANVMIDDSTCNDYIIKGFSLYSGALGELPDNLRNYWFFWIQLENYLKNTRPDNHISIKFTTIKKGTVLHRYIVKERHYFLLADNWLSGYDSRYFGLVNEKHIIGRPFIIWWSTAKAKGIKSISRIGRMVL